MKGHFNDVVETFTGIIRELNSGLALVTPCYLLKELLETKEIENYLKSINETK